MVTMFIHRNLVFEWVVGYYDASLSHSLIPSPTAHIKLWCPSALKWHLNLDLSPSDGAFAAVFTFEHIIFLSFLLSPTAVSSHYGLCPSLWSFFSIRLKLSWKICLYLKRPPQKDSFSSQLLHQTPPASPACAIYKLILVEPVGLQRIWSSLLAAEHQNTK